MKLLLLSIFIMLSPLAQLKAMDIDNEFASLTGKTSGGYTTIEKEKHKQKGIHSSQVFNILKSSGATHVTLRDRYYEMSKEYLINKTIKEFHFKYKSEVQDCDELAYMLMGRVLEAHSGESKDGGPLVGLIFGANKETGVNHVEVIFITNSGIYVSVAQHRSIQTLEQFKKNYKNLSVRI